jgi:hypothetical protein
MHFKPAIKLNRRMMNEDIKLKPSKSFERILLIEIHGFSISKMAEQSESFQII